MTTDFTKVYKSLYTVSPAPTIVEAPELPYLIGVGDPVSGEYVRAVEALYGVAYAIRFALKPTLVYSVRPLQGRCRADGEDLSGTTDRSAWQWSMIILQPEQATPELLDDAVRKVRKKKPGSAADAVRLERLAEGRCAQILHVGPYATETPAIERLLAFAGEAVTSRRVTITRSICPIPTGPPPRNSRRSSAIRSPPPFDRPIRLGFTAQLSPWIFKRPRSSRRNRFLWWRARQAKPGRPVMAGAGRRTRR